MAATSDSILSAGHKAYEGFAIALPPSAVPDNLIVGGHLLQLCNLRFTQAHGRNLVRFDRCLEFSFTLRPQLGTHASGTKHAYKK